MLSFATCCLLRHERPGTAVFPDGRLSGVSIPLGYLSSTVNRGFQIVGEEFHIKNHEGRFAALNLCDQSNVHLGDESIFFRFEC